MSRKKRQGGASSLDLFGTDLTPRYAVAPAARKRPTCATSDRNALVAIAGVPTRIPLRGRRQAITPEAPSQILRLTGDQEKAQGIARVSTTCFDWIADGLEVIRKLAYAERTVEGILALVKEKIGEPGHHNACGALISQARRAGYLVDTGRMEKAKAPEKHSRRIPVYRCGVKS